MTEPLLMTDAQAAKTLGISREHLRGLVRAGRIQIVQVGKRRFYSRASLEAFAAGEEPGNGVFVG